jgi:ArsR family metal-binding transcriptional regulator
MASFSEEAMMLLTSWNRTLFRPECNPNFQSLHMIAQLDQNVGPVLPYLNAAWGGFRYVADPPSVTFKVHGRLITIHGDRIAVNAIADEEEADRILGWLIREINDTWDHRADLNPSYESRELPKIIDIVRLLPRDPACRRCGQNGCLPMAALMAEGARGAEDCPVLADDVRSRLERYLAGFNLDA